MSEVVAAKRYADALFQLGKEKGTLDALAEEFRTVKTVFESNEQLFSFLSHPRLTLADKKQFIDKTFNSSSVIVVNTLKLLIERHRMNILSDMIEEFIQMIHDSQGIAEADIYTVRTLSDEEKSNLESSVAERFGKKSVIFHEHVDPTIIGGIKIKVGNTVIDGTISGKLNRIERSLKLANN